MKWVMEWISVNDRLPECDGMYLCYAHVGSIKGCGVYYFMPWESRFKSDFQDEVITHWMPLPPNPEVNEDED